MGLFTREKPKIKIRSTRHDSFSGWLKCTQCTELVHAKELSDNRHCCPKCDFHYRLAARARVESLLDSDSFSELFDHVRPLDPLEFKDTESYQDRLARAEAKSEGSEGILTGTGTLAGMELALGVMDFTFMAGSMGSVVGERITLLIELALEKRIPIVLVCASGGARMQESILSLMQMAKTSAALARLSEAGVPYISILTNPTTGGVTASFASLGDVIIAEPEALICFAGPRVIEQTLGEKLPPGAQRSEFLLKHGMIDCIVHRSKMREKLKSLLTYMAPKQ